jgi:hypothetical protein
MPLETRSRARTVQNAELQLPPPYSLITLREVGDAFAQACRVAPEKGAGTLVYVGRFDLAEFAVVLEPEEPLRTARRSFYAGMVALADTLSVLAPPEIPIEFIWPDAINVNLGLVGGGRLGWPKRAKEDEVPAWMVFAASLRTFSMTGEAGINVLTTALADEGFGEVTSDRLVETFARHFMMTIDSWQENGFKAVAMPYLARLAPEKGVRRDLDDNGDLLVRQMAARDVERKALLPLLAKPSWLDPKTGGPK